MAYNPGDSLSSYPFLDYLSGSSPQELRDQLRSIHLPFKIISIYSQGTNHIAWVSLSSQIKKVPKDSKVSKTTKKKSTRTKKTSAKE